MKSIGLIVILIGLTACTQVTSQIEVASASSPSSKTWLETQIEQFEQDIRQKYAENIRRSTRFIQKTDDNGDVKLPLQVVSLPDDLVQLSYRSRYHLGHHYQSVREYRLLDTKRQKIVPLETVLRYEVQAQMVEIMYQKLLEYQNMGWRGTPKNDGERRVWLVRNMPYVFKHGSFFSQNNDHLSLEFCSPPTMDNSYQACGKIENVQLDEIMYLGRMDNH